MTIAVVTSGQGNLNGTSLTLTTAINATGADCVVACVNNNGSIQRITGVTYAGVALTKIKENVGNPNTSIWVLVAPTTGTNNLVVTASTLCQITAWGVMLSGIDQTTPTTASSGGSTIFANSPFSHTITDGAGGIALDVCFSNQANSTTGLAPDGSQTQIGTSQSNGGGNGGISYKAAATAMQWTWTGGQDQVAHSVVAFAAAASGGSVGSATGTSTANAVGSAQKRSVGTITAHATVAGVSGAAIVTPPLKNNTGTLLASETGVTVYIYTPSTGALVVKKTAQTTNSSGIMTVVDAALVSGTSYRVVIALSSGAEGMSTLSA